MRRDIRDTFLYREAQEFYKSTRRPGSGRIFDAAEVTVVADGRKAAIVGTSYNNLEGSAQTRIYQIDLMNGQMTVVTSGPNVDRHPKYSPDGKQIAFLSDLDRAGDFQLFLADASSGAIRSTPRIDGWVEYLHWSPDGTQILLGAAGYEADTSGSQGAISTAIAKQVLPSWMPRVEAGGNHSHGRSVWIYELRSNCVRRLTALDSTTWEAVWIGNSAIAAVISPGHEEGLWYTAKLEAIDLQTGLSRHLYAPNSQLGAISACASGRRIAIVEAISSDRRIVAGDLKLVETPSRAVKQVDTHGVDITFTEWRSEDRLLVAGHRGFETVVALYDDATSRFEEAWCSREMSGSGHYISVCGFGQSGDCALITEGFKQSPEIAVIGSGKYRTIKSFDLGYSERAEAIAAVECVTWHAPDGLQIQGWLLRPKTVPPHPLVMNIHGGPVWMWHPTSLSRSRCAPLWMLLSRGYAIFLPNPRGSAGRGQAFSRLVLGDMGGADSSDYLSGLDHLVRLGVADPNRIGLMGVSYGGFMTCWLIANNSRFAAAVSIAPHINHVSAHLLSNIPDFVRLFLADTYTNLTGRYYDRSPILHAHKVRTPTLNICGALDKSAPPEEATQFHRALLENGTTTALVTYPEEGHGVSKLPASIDFAARVVNWFEEYMQ